MMSQENIECIRKCLQEGYDQGPGLGWDEPEADGGESYERVHGDVVGPLKSDESMSVLDLIMWRAGRKTFSCSENEESCEKGISCKDISWRGISEKSSWRGISEEFCWWIEGLEEYEDERMNLSIL